MSDGMNDYRIEKLRRRVDTLRLGDPLDSPARNVSRSPAEGPAPYQAAAATTSRRTNGARQESPNGLAAVSRPPIKGPATRPPHVTPPNQRTFSGGGPSAAA